MDWTKLFSPPTPIKSSDSGRPMIPQGKKRPRIGVVFEGDRQSASAGSAVGNSDGNSVYSTLSYQQEEYDVGPSPHHAGRYRNIYSVLVTLAISIALYVSGAVAPTLWGLHHPKHSTLRSHESVRRNIQTSVLGRSDHPPLLGGVLGGVVVSPPKEIMDDDEDMERNMNSDTTVEWQEAQRHASPTKQQGGLPLQPQIVVAHDDGAVLHRMDTEQGGNDVQVEGYLANGETVNFQSTQRRRLTDTADSQGMMSSSSPRNDEDQQLMIVTEESQRQGNRERNLSHGSQSVVVQAYPSDATNPQKSYELPRQSGQNLRSKHLDQPAAMSKIHNRGLLDGPSRTEHVKQQVSTIFTHPQPIHIQSDEPIGQNVHRQTIPASDYQQRVLPGTGYQQQPVPETAYQQQASPGTGYQQQTVPETGYQQRASTGSGYQQQAVRGTGYQQHASPGTGYQQQASPGTGYQQQTVPGAGYQQQASRGTGYQQQVSPGTGYRYQQRATPGTGYQQQASHGTGYQQLTVPGPGNQQQASPGTGYQQQAPLGTDYQQQASPGIGYQQQASSGTSYQQQASPGIGNQQQVSPGTGYQQQGSPGTGYQQQPSNLSHGQQSGMGDQVANLGIAFQSTHQPEGSSTQERGKSNESNLPMQQKLDQPLIMQQTQEITSVQEQQHDNQSPDKNSARFDQTPTHIRICQVVLGQEIAPFMVEHKTCIDEVDPTLALAEIFLSSYLAHHARLQGYRVEYDHNCGGHRTDHRLIQELLPSPLNVPETLNYDMTKTYLQELCKMMVPTEQNRHESTALDILLWDTSSSMGQRLLSTTSAEVRALENPTEGTPVAMLERLIPVVFSNMYHATMRSRLVKTALKAGYGVLKGRNASSERLALGTAVIYLPCRDRGCADLAIIPYTSYLLHLPLSVHVVDIVVSSRCVERLPGCRRYVDDLASTIRQFSPLMSVEVIAAEPSSPDVMARLVEAEHVLCGPGFGMVCLFPALARDSGRMTLFDIGSDQIDGESASSFVSRLPQDRISHVSPPTSVFSVTFLSEFGGREAAMSTFAQLPPNKDAGDCRFFRGRVGRWNQDMAYAEHAQYRTPLSHYSGNAEKVFRRRKVEQGEFPNLKFRPSTTYRFDESRYQTCAAEHTTQEGVCAMLKSLGAHRIFILGDSLNLQLAQSMWMWLTNANHGDSPTNKGSLDPNFKTTLQCLGYGPYTLQFIRNDELLENEEPVSIDSNQKNCQTYCYPWTKTYQEDLSRTILIFNVGAHLHEFERYQSAIDRFVDVFDAMNRPNDIVLFRTLVPGHWDCSRPGLQPFPNFAAYQKDTEEHPNAVKDPIYTWSKFSEYNDYTIRKLDNRRFEALSTTSTTTTTGTPTTTTPSTTKALMEVIDVFPMTILRPDGHCSDEFRPPSYLETDCLHYDLPGPIDWWSHMALSHLQDIATAENFLARQPY